MMIAADNLNVLHPKISEALRTLDPGPLKETARLCEQAGAGLDLALINVLRPEVQSLARTIHSIAGSWHEARGPLLSAANFPPK